MAVKLTGAEYKRFITDPVVWGENGYYEDGELYLDGRLEEDGIDPETLADTAEIKIAGGYVLDLPDGKEMTLIGLFQKWRRLQTTETFLVTCPKDMTEKMKELIKNVGGTINE